MEGNEGNGAVHQRSIYDLWATDKKSETDGIVVSYGEAGEFRVLRAGLSNPRFQERMAALGRKYRRQIDLNIITGSDFRPELVTIVAETVVIDGWIRERDGTVTQLRGNPRRVERIFIEMPDLFDDVYEQATKPAAFKEKILEADAKN